jgi:hypothetical protein
VGWRAVFWAYLPLAVALAGAIGRAVPPDGETDRSVWLNLASSAAFTLAVMAFVIATTLLPGRGGAAAGAILLGLAIALTGLFIAVDRRSAAPLLPRALLRERPLRQGALGGLLNTLTTSSALTLVTLYLQNTRGRSPLVAGLMLMPFSLAAVAGSTVAPWVLARWRPQRVAAAGLALIALSDTALITAVGSSWALPVCNVAGGAGIGLGLGRHHRARHQRPGRRPRHRLGDHQHRRATRHRSRHRHSPARRRRHHRRPRTTPLAPGRRLGPSRRHQPHRRHCLHPLGPPHGSRGPYPVIVRYPTEPRQLPAEPVNATL